MVVLTLKGITMARQDKTRKSWPSVNRWRTIPSFIGSTVTGPCVVSKVWGYHHSATFPTDGHRAMVPGLRFSQQFPKVHELLLLQTRG